MNKPTFIIIDAYSLLYRAFFALPVTLANSAGEITNAVYGFTTMLMRLLDDENPAAIVVAIDLPDETFRHQAFADYKAHRKPMPDELRPQVPMLRELLAAMNIPIIANPGFEADDIIGTLAQRLKEDYRVLIVTGDRDALQLVDDSVQVLATRRGITDTILFTPQAVVERYGITPAQVPDMKALMGDSSDNIPGVPGIGEKTAAKLIAQYGNLAAVLANAAEVKGKIGALLITYADQALQSKELATIHCQVPLDDFNVDDCLISEWNFDDTEALFRRLDFRSQLAKLLERRGKAGIESPPIAELAFKECRMLAAQDVVQLQRDLQQVKKIAIVPVSSGEDALRDDMLGLAIAADNLVVYIPLQSAPKEQSSLFADEEAEQQSDQVLKVLGPIFADDKIEKMGYDLKSLYLLLRAHDILLVGLAFDTQLAGYLLDASSAHDLAELALKYLHIRCDVANPVALLRTSNLAEMAQAAGQRAQLIQLLQPPMIEELCRDEMLTLYNDIEMPLITILAEMEWLGISLDCKLLDDLSAELEKSIYHLEGEIYQLAGEKFTIQSPKQLQAILYDKLGYAKGRKTKTGYSTDAETLAALADKHEIVNKILLFRELSKLKSTYVDSLPRLVDPRDGRIHTHYNQAVTVTGRLSSSDPNLQNIPIRSEEGREIRRAFIPRNSDWQLLAADYSQIELRVLAHYSLDEALIEVFRQGEDLHTATACRVFNVSPEQVTREMRRMAKVVNFSIPYGTTAFGLAGQLGVTRALAEELMNTYLQRFPGVADYMKRIVDGARELGYVSTLLGRRRLLPDLASANQNIRLAAERTAINTPIQGSAADIMKLSMLRMADNLRRHSYLKSRLLLQVHDEMVLEVPHGEVDEVAVLLKDAMVNAYQLTVPLEVEVKAGNNWRDIFPQRDVVEVELSQ